MIGEHDFTLKSTGLGMIDYDPSMEAVYWSPTLNKVFGVSPGTSPSLPTYLALIHPDDRDTVRNAINKAKQSSENRAITLEHRLLRSDGETRWVSVRIEALISQPEERARTVCSVIDITGWKEKEGRASHNQARLSAILSIAPSAIISADGQQRITLFNEAAEKLFGYRRDEIVGQPLDLLIPRQFRFAHRQHVERFWSSPINTRRMGERKAVAALRKDGSEFPAEASISKIEVGGEKIFIVVLQDITERKQAEDRIRLLSREVSHRAKNMLAVIQSIARQTAAESEPLVFAERFTERIAALAASLDLMGKSDWEGINLGKLVASQLTPFADLTGNRVVLNGPPLEIQAEAAQTLGMAFHELATNSVKYGALSVVRGHLSIGWRIASDNRRQYLHIRWSEHGGPEPKTPARQGFGYTVMVSMAEYALNARVKLKYPRSGLIWELIAPLEQILQHAPLAHFR